MGEEHPSISPNTPTPNLKEAILSISALISISHSIKVFSGKWKSIRVKLEELFTNLTAIENWNDNNGNSSLSIAVDSISATLKIGDELANRCLGFSYSGKLLMQSDLDILSTKLDNHVRRFSDIYAEGLLTQSYAIVVSRPSGTASKDDMRFYVNDLLSRLKIGSAEMKKRALVLFNELIEEDDRYVKIVVEIDGFINSVVKFLEFQEEGIRMEAAKSVCLLAGFEFCKSVMINLGVIGSLVRVLESGNEVSQEFATRCLMKCTENSDNLWSVSAHGGVTALLKICSSSRSTSFSRKELVPLACGVLKNLTGVEEIKKFMIEEGAVGELVELVRSKDEATLMSVIDLLQVMSYRDESVREMVVKEGGVRAMVRVLDPRSSVSTKGRETAFRGITSLCSSSEDSISVLMSHSFMDHVLYFLRYGEVSVQELALKAASWLCGTSEEAKRAMGDAGFMPVLVMFLDSKSFEVREMAAETLSSMMVVAKNRKKFVQSDKNVGVLLQRRTQVTRSYYFRY